MCVRAEAGAGGRDGGCDGELDQVVASMQTGRADVLIICAGVLQSQARVRRNGECERSVGGTWYEEGISKGDIGVRARCGCQFSCMRGKGEEATHFCQLVAR